jgi:hypothetical protein
VTGTTPPLASPALDRLLTAAADLIESLAAERAKAERQDTEAEELQEQAQAAIGELETRTREKSVQECALAPLTLVGSWFHKLEAGRIVWQGSVVAEVQPGCYLLELHNWQDERSAHQRLVTIKDIAEQEPGFEYRFYDSVEWMRLAGTRAPCYEHVDLQDEVG